MFHNIRHCSKLDPYSCPSPLEACSEMCNNVRQCSTLDLHSSSSPGGMFQNFRKCSTMFDTWPLLLPLPLEVCSKIFDSVRQCSTLDPYSSPSLWRYVQKYSTMFDHVLHSYSSSSPCRCVQKCLTRLDNVGYLTPTSPPPLWRYVQKCSTIFDNVRKCSTLDPYSSPPPGGTSGNVWQYSTMFETWPILLPLPLEVRSEISDKVRQWFDKVQHLFNTGPLLLHLPLEVRSKMYDNVWQYSTLDPYSSPFP